jgi:hypothetical protein
MMLTLALRNDPDHVYERALLRFTPDEVAEGFAADVGMAVPTQVQEKLKEDPRPLMQRFKELAPAHPPISIQRWSWRRVGLLVIAVVGVVVVAAAAVDWLLAGLR